MCSEGLDILVVTGNRIITRKLYSKLSPLTGLELVRTVYLVTRSDVSDKKINRFSPRGIMTRNIVLNEAYKISVIVYVLLKYKPDVVIAVGLIPHGIYANVLGAIFGKKRIFLSMGKNELIYSDKTRWQRLLLKIAFLANAIGTRGTSSGRWLIDHGFDADKVFVLHNVFDFDDFRARECAKKYDLIYVGLLEHYKRIDLLIGVVDRLVREHELRDIKLVIVGEGSLEKKLRHKSDFLGLSNNILFLPAGDLNYLCDLYNQSKVFVMTSEGEGLPMAMIEAMSCGLPVVIFDDADIPDVVHHGENGMLIKPGDLDGFAAAVERLLEDEDLYKKLSRGALAMRNEYRHEYSLEQAKVIWEKVLTQCQE